MYYVRQWIFVGLVVVFFFPGVGWAQDSPSSEMVLDRVTGQPTLRLADYLGKVVVLNFWATWCPPCIKEIPVLIHFQEVHGSKGVQVIGVNFMEDSDRQRLADYVKAQGVNYPVVFGAAVKMVDFARGLGGVYGLPVTKIIDQQGKVVTSHVGGLTEDQLLGLVEPLLKK